MRPSEPQPQVTVQLFASVTNTISTQCENAVSTVTRLCFDLVDPGNRILCEDVHRRLVVLEPEDTII